jgi:hypothetical protein
LDFFFLYTTPKTNIIGNNNKTQGLKIKLGAVFIYTLINLALRTNTPNPVVCPELVGLAKEYTKHHSRVDQLKIFFNCLGYKIVAYTF